MKKLKKNISGKNIKREIYVPGNHKLSYLMRKIFYILLFFWLFMQQC